MTFDVEPPALWPNVINYQDDQSLDDLALIMDQIEPGFNIVADREAYKTGVTRNSGPDEDNLKDDDGLFDATRVRIFFDRRGSVMPFDVTDWDEIRITVLSAPSTLSSALTMMFLNVSSELGWNLFL